MPEPDNLDIDRLMWTGYTPTPRWLPKDATGQESNGEGINRVEPPATARQRDVNTSRKLPPRRPPFYPFFGTKVKPPSQAPDVWSLPIHDFGETCIQYYETEYTVFTYTADATRMLVVESINYELDREKFPVNDVVEIAVYRDSVEMARFEEFVAIDADNPVERYTFGSFRAPNPLFIAVDKNQTLTVTAKARGSEPFIRTPADLLVGNVKAGIYGYLAQLRDTRDGGFKSRVDGDELDRHDRRMNSIIQYYRKMDDLEPYFADKFTEDPMGYYYEQQGQDDQLNVDTTSDFVDDLNINPMADPEG